MFSIYPDRVARTCRQSQMALPPDGERHRKRLTAGRKQTVRPGRSIGFAPRDRPPHRNGDGNAFGYGGTVRHRHHRGNSEEMGQERTGEETTAPAPCCARIGRHRVRQAGVRRPASRRPGGKNQPGAAGPTAAVDRTETARIKRRHREKDTAIRAKPAVTAPIRANSTSISRISATAGFSPARRTVRPNGVE